MNNRLFYVVSGVYSFKEMVEEDFEISFIECFGCSSIFYVGLRLFQGAVYGLSVVEAFGKIHYFRAYEDISPIHRFL